MQKFNYNTTKSVIAKPRGNTEEGIETIKTCHPISDLQGLQWQKGIKVKGKTGAGKSFKDQQDYQTMNRSLFSLIRKLSYKFKTLSESQFRRIWEHSQTGPLHSLSPSFPKHSQRRKAKEKQCKQLKTNENIRKRTDIVPIEKDSCHQAL